MNRHSVQKECAMLPLSKVAKTLLPKTVKRFILLDLMGVRRRYRHLRSHASRTFLEREILPWLGQRYERTMPMCLRHVRLNPEGFEGKNFRVLKHEKI